jgi:hypothetical protein
MLHSSIIGRNAHITVKRDIGKECMNSTTKRGVHVGVADMKVDDPVSMSLLKRTDI